jgi:hypothetical protein
MWVRSILISLGVAFKFRFKFILFFCNELLWLAITKKIWSFWDSPNVKSIHSKHINPNNVGPPTYNGFQEDNIGPSIWDKIKVLMGTCCGTWWELEKQVENSFRTWWERIENNKNPNNPQPNPPTQKDKILYWVHAAIPHWLRRISIPNCIPHLIWPKGMNWGGRWGR